MLEIARAHEADLLRPAVRAEDPGDVFHVVERRKPTVGVTGAGRDEEGDAVADDPLAAGDDFVRQR